MTAHVPDEVGSDAPLYETPLSVGPLEAVVVPTTDDGLERQAGRRLERGEVCAGHRPAGLFVDLDGEIGREVLRPGCAIVVDDDVVSEHLLDGIGTAHRPGSARKRGVG